MTHAASLKKTGLAWIMGFSSLALASCGLRLHLRGDANELTSGATVHIDRALKGDELWVARGRSHATVRLIGVAAFEAVIVDPLVQKYARLAEQHLAVEANTWPRVFFEGAPMDGSGRYQAYVQSGDRDLGAEMVRLGLAPVYTEFPFDREPAYLALEAQARHARAGLWAEPDATKVVAGLRRQWRVARVRRGSASLADPLVGRIKASL